MTFQSTPPTPRRQDLPIQIGPRHGYRIEGDHVFINAELLIPPYRSGGEWTLELWATDQPHREQEPLTGVRVAQLALELPTPIGPYVHQVDTRAAARLPLQGRAYAMTLALLEQGLDGQSTVHAFASYPETQAFTAPHFEGSVGYAVEGREVVLKAGGVFNPRPSANLSGTLSLELWAFPEGGAATAADNEGVRLAACELEPIAGQSHLTAVELRVAFSEPPEGRFQLSLLLCEWTFALGYVARDRRDFPCLYQRSAAVTAAPASPTRPIDRLRLVPAAEPGTPSTTTAAAVAAPGLVSIQTGSVEALAEVKGLSLKIAKEIVKARPFSSLADLIRVRGLGQKTIDRIKHLVTL